MQEQGVTPTAGNFSRALEAVKSNEQLRQRLEQKEQQQTELQFAARPKKDNRPRAYPDDVARNTIDTQGHKL